jgi:hypothetical protein
MRGDKAELGRHYAAASRRGNALNGAGGIAIYALAIAYVWGNGRLLVVVGVMAGALIPSTCGYPTP